MSVKNYRPDQKTLNDIKHQIRSHGSSLTQCDSVEEAERLTRWLQDCMPPERYGVLRLPKPRNTEVNIYLWHTVRHFESG